jgi:hypothetical protein
MSEALRKAEVALRELENATIRTRTMDIAEDTLRAALAEPEQEPVAHCRVRPLQGNEASPQVFVKWVKQPVPGPLFAAPPRREPLTQEAIDDLWKKGSTKLGGWDYVGHEVMYESSFEDAVRAIEAAQGIGVKP